MSKIAIHLNKRLVSVFDKDLREKITIDNPLPRSPKAYIGGGPYVIM